MRARAVTIGGGSVIETDAGFAARTTSAAGVGRGVGDRPTGILGTSAGMAGAKVRSTCWAWRAVVGGGGWDRLGTASGLSLGRL